MKCIDVRERLIAETDRTSRPGSRNERARLLERLSTEISDELKSWSDEKSNPIPRILIDSDKRDPYKRFQESKGPLNQIRTRTASGGIVDLAESSAAIEGFHLFRAYVDSHDEEAKKAIDTSIEQALRRNVDVEQ